MADVIRHEEVFNEFYSPFAPYFFGYYTTDIDVSGLLVFKRLGTSVKKQGADQQNGECF
jgi:hypothetical protein